MYACSPAGQTYSIHFLHTCTICYYKHHYRSLHPLLHNTYYCVIILFEVYTLFLMRIILQFPSLPPLFLSPLPLSLSVLSVTRTRRPSCISTRMEGIITQECYSSQRKKRSHACPTGKDRRDQRPYVCQEILSSCYILFSMS